MSIKTSGLCVDVSTLVATHVAVDVAEDVPRTIANLAAWWRGDSNYTLDTGVSAWADKQNGWVLSQGTGSQQPTYTAANANFNGQPTLDFVSSSSQYVESTSAFANDIDNEPITVVAAVRHTLSTGVGAIFAQGYTASSGPFLVLRRNATTQEWLSNDTVANQTIAGSATVTSAAGVVAVTYDWDGTNSLQLWWSGSKDGSPATVTRVPTSAIDTFSIGALVRSTVSNFLDAEVAEVCVYKRVITDAEMATLTAYMNARYGL